MARITSQKAAQVYGGLFDLVLGASQRAREIRRGSTPKVKCDNGPVVTALKEIEEGLYTKKDYMKSLPKPLKKKGIKDEYFPS
jgi:DNA-directed RNA polymerase omega subunit